MQYGRKGQGHVGAKSKKYDFANEVAKTSSRRKVCRAYERTVRQAGQKACRDAE
jgi:hypothetical protein